MSLVELAKELGLNPKRVASTKGGEWHSACPICGGKDRFIIQPSRAMKNCEGYFKCRQCKISGDAIEFCKRFLGLSFKEAVERANGVGTTIHLSSKRYQYSHSYHEIKPPSDRWCDKAASFVDWAHFELLKRKDVIEQLTQRGLDREAIVQYKLGFCSQEFLQSRIEWGLEAERKDNGEEKKVWIPKGIVIPVSEKNRRIVRLKIRRSDWRKGDRKKYVVISGSMNGLNIIGDTNEGLMVVVESELDAFGLHYACSDFLFCIAIGSNDKYPDNLVDYLAQRKRIIICPDNDEAGETMRKKWIELYPHARSLPTPLGKDIGEAIEQGLDVRSWLLENNYESQS